jgi:archaemetzincin
MKTIIIQPILFELPADLSSSLEQHLSKEFDALVKTVRINEMPPLNLFDKNRRQWKSNGMLLWLLDRNKPDRNTKVLAVCDFDAYSNGLNFVFGQANLDGRVSAIYLPRLRQEFHGLTTDNSLFYKRLIKETVHELGHAFGLKHCGNRMCVMHFSNSLQDTDIKGNNLCDICRTLTIRSS